MTVADLSSLSADQLAEKVRRVVDSHTHVPSASAVAEARADLAELVRRLKTADATVDELATELADERTLHQATLGRLTTAEDALNAELTDAVKREKNATGEGYTYERGRIDACQRALAAIRPKPKP